MKIVTLIVMFNAAIFIEGCASLGQLFSSRRQLEVTFVSQPAGASIYYKDKYKGVASQTLYFNIDDQERAQGHVVIGKAMAVWPSGATHTIASETFDITKGLSWKITMIRPVNAPNPDLDYRHANELERNQIEREKLKQLKEQKEQNELWGREKGDGREAAASLCQSLPFSSSQEDCMRIVRRARFFSHEAVTICKSMAFDSSKLDCLRAAADREYLKADIQICRHKAFDSQKIDCLRRGNRF